MDKASRYYLSKTTDPFGNTMEYFYDKETGCIPSGSSACGDTSSTPTPNDACTRNDLAMIGNYDRAIYLKEVRWSGNPHNTVSTSDDYTATLRILLNRTGRTDNFITTGDHCNQAQYGSQLLSEVVVQVCLTGQACDPNATNQWHTLRRYALEYFDNSRNSLLRSLSEYGKGGSTLLRQQTFRYHSDPEYCGSSCAESAFLRQADNGWGGKVSYYLSPQSVNCLGGVCLNRVSTRVDRMVVDDGVGNYATIDRCYPAAPVANESALFNPQYEYLGYAEVYLVTRAITTSNSVLTQTLATPCLSQQAANSPPSEKIEWVSFYTRNGPGTTDIDPRRGRTKSSKVYGYVNTTLTEFYSQDLTGDGQSGSPFAQDGWEVVNLDNNRKWIRQRWVTERSYGIKGDGTRQTEAGSSKFFTYETAGYGRLLKVEEFDGYYSAGSVLRTTTTDYATNPGTPYLTATPSRQRVYQGSADALENCRSEMRTIYWDPDGNRSANHNQDGSYTSTPYSTLIAKTERALNYCNDTTPDPYDSSWAVTRYHYDGYGNQTSVNVTGQTNSEDDILTTDYDPFYHLFPITQTKPVTVSFLETAAWYGVNGLSVNDPKAVWGAMQRYCAVNELCTRQSYDEFGRPVRRWEAGTASDDSSTWPPDGEAQTLWQYSFYNPTVQSATTVIESHAPRCRGNFTRQLYDGLGQLIQQQTPSQTWQDDTCGDSASGLEVAVDYAYNASGQQVRASVPHYIPHYTGGDYRRTPVWNQGSSSTVYDALGRPLKSIDPGGAQTWYESSGRQSWVRAMNWNTVASDGIILKWQEVDGLGHLSRVRTQNSVSGVLVPEGAITMTHDVMGNLTCVYQAGSGLDASSDPECDGNGNIGKVTRMVYDRGGRKLSMNDADMGAWIYTYDRQSKLKQQVDGCGNSTYLEYDVLMRLKSKNLLTGAVCNTTQPTYQISYEYGQEQSIWNRSRGQLIAVSRSDGVYRKTLAYNGVGLLASEVLSITGASELYTTTYDYDLFLRPLKTTYPDGDAVTTGYNSMGMPNLLYSSQNGALVADVQYDEAGRMTRMMMPAGGPIWRHQSYWPWTSVGGTGMGNSDGRLRSITVTNSINPVNYLAPAYKGAVRLVNYNYDTYGNITSYYDSNQPHLFSYDQQNRIKWAYRIAAPATPDYTYDEAGRLTKLDGVVQTAVGNFPAHALKPQTGTYQYNATGNLTVRGDQQLSWDAENHLSQVSVSGSLSESYLYDPNGQRIKKQVGNSPPVFYVTPNYEVYSVTIPSPQVPITVEDVWWDDDYPGPVITSSVTNHNWSWVASNPSAFSGSASLRSELSSGEQSFSFFPYPSENSQSYSRKALKPKAEDTLYFYLRLDATTPAEGVMVEWMPNNWDTVYAPGAMPHFRAAWGDPTWVNQWNAQVTGTLPAAGNWVRMAVSVKAMGLQNQRIEGLNITLKNGKAAFDKMGKYFVIEPQGLSGTFIAISTASKYYTFNGQRIAVSTGNYISDTFAYLHGDHLGSVVVATDYLANVLGNNKPRYKAYGSERSPSVVNLPGDVTFTGQRQDTTGLVYMNARYYDPNIGAFISPDTIVPDPTNLHDYNRFMYVRGRVMNANDPTGHQTNCISDNKGSWDCNNKPSASALTVKVDPSHPQPICSETPGCDPNGFYKTMGAAFAIGGSGGLVIYFGPVFLATEAAVCAEGVCQEGGSKASAVASEASAVTSEAAPAVDHIVLGLKNFGLEQTAKNVGGRILTGDEWMKNLQEAIRNPMTKFTVSLDGFAGDSPYSQVMKAAQNGATPFASPTNWEMAQLLAANRLKDVIFMLAGKVIENPFAN